MAGDVVDPFTGLPSSSPQAQSMSGQIGIDAASAMGYQEGALMGMLENFPTATTSMMWNAGRGRNTIMRGGFARNQANSRGFVRNHMVPRSFGRMSSIYNVDRTNAPEVSRKHGMYSPFNFLADQGNNAANWAMRKSGVADALKGYRFGEIPDNRQGRIARKLATTYGLRDPKTTAALNRGENLSLFSSGVMARQITAAKIVSGSRRINPQKVVENIGKLDPEIGKAMGYLNSPTNSSLAHLTSASVGGVVSQRFGGYMTTAMAGAPSEMTKGILAKAGKDVYLDAAQNATRNMTSMGLDIKGGKVVDLLDEGKHVGKLKQFGHFGSAIKSGNFKGASVLGARGLGFAGKAVPIVGQVMMAYDLTKMGMSALTGAADTAKDAVKSFQGSINKGVMGMGYQDTEVAATSRARGVMAIQNSRLNARSVLGSEAGPLAAHFG